MGNKRVTIAIEMDSHFIRMLKTTTHLRGLGNDKEEYKNHTAADALAVVVLAEAIGAIPEQVHSLTPIEWRPHIQAISDYRKVKELTP